MAEKINLYRMLAEEMSCIIGIPDIFSDRSAVVVGDYDDTVSAECWEQACLSSPPIYFEENGKTYVRPLRNMDDPDVEDIANHLMPLIDSVDILLEQTKKIAHRAYMNDNLWCDAEQDTKHALAVMGCFLQIEEKNRKDELIARIALNLAASILHHDYLEHPDREICDSNTGETYYFGTNLHRLSADWRHYDITGKEEALYQADCDYDKNIYKYKNKIAKQNNAALNSTAETESKIHRFRVQPLKEYASRTDWQNATYSQLFRIMYWQKPLRLFKRFGPSVPQLTRIITQKKYRIRLTKFAEFVKKVRDTFPLQDAAAAQLLSFRDKLLFVHWSFFFYHLECDYHLKSIYQFAKEVFETKSTPQLTKRAVLSVWGNFNWLPPTGDGNDRHSARISADDLLHDSEAIPHLLAPDTPEAERWFAEYSLVRVIEAEARFQLYYWIRDRRIQFTCNVKLIQSLFDFFYSRYPIIQQFADLFDVEEISIMSKKTSESYARSSSRFSSIHIICLLPKFLTKVLQMKILRIILLQVKLTKNSQTNKKFSKKREKISRFFNFGWFCSV